MIGGSYLSHRLRSAARCGNSLWKDDNDRRCVYLHPGRARRPAEDHAKASGVSTRVRPVNVWLCLHPVIPATVADWDSVRLRADALTTYRYLAGLSEGGKQEADAGGVFPQPSGSALFHQRVLE